MTQLPAVVKVSSYVRGLDRTMIMLWPLSDLIRATGQNIEWPVNLFLPGDVREQNPPGTEYKITIARE